MTLGYLGELQFNVSNDKTLTFNDLNHSSSAKFHEHEIIGEKPLSEFLGCDLDKLTFTVELNSFLGIDINSQVEKLRKYEQSGTPLDFVLGSKPFGVDKWTIESASRAYDVIYANGACTQVKLDLSLSEYISDSKFKLNGTKDKSFIGNVENSDKSDTISSYSDAKVPKSMNAILNTIKH